jgi:hypothetical protein
LGWNNPLSGGAFSYPVEGRNGRSGTRLQAPALAVVAAEVAARVRVARDFNFHRVAVPVDLLAAGQRHVAQEDDLGQRRRDVETGARGAPESTPDGTARPAGGACDIGLHEFPGPFGTVFLRADVNDDSIVDLSDAIATLGWLFLGEADPGCIAAIDMNQDGNTDISDGRERNPSLW